MLTRENKKIVKCSICKKKVINKLLNNLHDLLFDNFLHSPLREGTKLFTAFKIVLYRVINDAPLKEGNMFFKEGYHEPFSDFNWVDRFTIEDIDALAIYIQRLFICSSCSSCRKLICSSCRKLANECLPFSIMNSINLIWKYVEYT